jgi:ribonuclease P protein subunit POP4
MTPITAENLASHELIGLKCKVIDAMNPYLIGIEGTIVDETKNMIIIKNKKEWKIPKKDVILEFTIGKKVIIKGSSLVGRPEDRVKIYGHRSRS